MRLPHALPLLGVLLCSALTIRSGAQTPAPPQPPLPDPPSAGPIHAIAGALPVPSATAVTPAIPAAARGDSPKDAVARVISMFTPNEGINVESTGKPLPTTGSWGVQVNFPNGLPQVCVDNDVPCAMVYYRVPEAKIVCSWTMGFVTRVEPADDGTMVHVSRLLLLDENESAARYTLRKGWQRNEKRPRPVVYIRPDYPKIAQEAGIGGVVQVRIEVNPDGTVRSAAGVGGPAMLQKPVVAAVQQWKYDPMLINGRPTSFRVDEQFNYSAGRIDISAGMDPSGKVIEDNRDPRLGGGFRSDGASSGSWATCTLATGCTAAAPVVPK